jgi:hypothetical protein
MKVLLAALAAAAALLVAELATGVNYGGQRVADPCKPRRPLEGRGLDRSTQRFVLHGLDVAACRVGKSREELVLELAHRGVDVVDLARRLESRLGAPLAWIEAILDRLRAP